MGEVAIKWVLATIVGCAVALQASSGLAQVNPMSNSFLDELWSSKTIIQILVGSAFVTAMINTIWFLVSAALQGLQHWWNATWTVYPVEFSRGMKEERYAKIRDAIEGFSCLHVRYGTDQYLSMLASEQEKYEGRLRNNVLPIKVRFDRAGNAVFTLRLPLHKRIGTQFKCFVTVRRENMLGSVEEFLKSCDRVKGVSVSRGVKSNRIYFLLDRFGEVTTVDGHTNNMVYPE
jgi:hypothetical protein